MGRNPTLPAAILVAGLALLATACGGSPSAGTAAASAQQTDPVAFSHCMRFNVVTNFPDPVSGGATQRSAFSSSG